MAITKEINLIGIEASRFVPKMSALQNNPIKRQKLATELAKKYLKCYSRMEEHVIKFEEIARLQLVSTRDFFKWFTPNSEQAKQELISLRQEYANLLQGTQANRTSQEALRISAVNLKGISKDLSTAQEQGITVIERYIAILKESEAKWQDIISIIDEKLRSLP